MSVCPSCALPCVSPSGSKSSSVLVVGEFPGEEEIKSGKPFTGPAGGVLRTEFARHGVDLWLMQVTNIWLHTPNDSDDCFQVGLAECLKLAKGKQAILLVGSSCVEFFVGRKVSEVTGLQVKSSYLSAPFIMAAYNPAIAFHRPIGELRFAINKFATHIQKENLV